MDRKGRVLPRIVYALLKIYCFLAAKIKYGFTTDKMPKLKEPYIMLSNHTTEEDMLFTTLACRGHMSFVCGEHLLRNPSYGKYLRILLDPIPLPKGGASFSAMREILKRVSEGDNICMYPEGKRSFHGVTIPSPEALGKLVKKAGCALVTYRIRGGYFTYPRWARQHLRKGHVEGKVMGVYSSELLKGMSAKEITDIINRDTYENAYDVQREKRWIYKGKDLAYGMDHILFICPCCKAMDSIKTSGDDFFCTACGMRGTYNEYGFLEGKDLPFDNVRDWMRFIEPEFDAFAAAHEPGELLFTEENVRLYQMMEDYRNRDILISSLKVYRDRMEIAGKALSGEGEDLSFVFPFEEINYLSILFGNILLFTYKGEYYGLTGEAFRAWKCGRLWHLVKGDTDDPTKEM